MNLLEDASAAVRTARSAPPAPLVVIETHPVQYHAPVYAAVQEKYGIGVTAIYGSNFSAVGYRDAEFQAAFAWDTDLLSGYQSRFLSTVEKGGGRTHDTVSARGIGRALRGLEPSAVLLVGYSPRFYHWAWLEALRAGVPVLFRAETTPDAQSGGAIKHQLRDLMLRRLYGRCARLLYIGENSRKHYAALGCPGEKLVFSPYCVDTTPFRCDESARNALRAQCRASLGIREDEMVLMFSGKLSHRKGPDLLLAAARMVEAEHRIRTAVLFVGDGELRPVLEEAANRSPRVKACFAGFQNQKQLSPYYHAADLFVLRAGARRHGAWWSTKPCTTDCLPWFPIALAAVPISSFHAGRGRSSRRVRPAVCARPSCARSLWRVFRGSARRAAPRSASTPSKRRLRELRMLIDRQSQISVPSPQTGVNSLVLVGNPGSVHVGAHFGKAALESGLGLQFLKFGGRFFGEPMAREMELVVPGPSP